MSKTTGQALDGLDEIRQCIGDVLTTPVGSRVMQRDYGSSIPDLIDQPLNAATLQRILGATVQAIAKWVPDASISALRFSSAAAGSLSLDIELIDTRSGNAAFLQQVAL